jgi:polar amino acid transport system substrate-binding protein
MSMKTRSLTLAAPALLAATLVTSLPVAADCVYRVALDGTFAPHAMPTMDGKTEGFNIDLANAIGKQLGCRMDITAAQWSGLLPALQAGTYDFIVAPTTATQERAENLLLTEGYLNTDYQFVVKAGTPAIEELADLKDKVISVNKGSAYDSWARDLAPEIGWRVESYGTNTDAMQAVMSGRAHANVAGNTVAAWAVKQNPGLELSYLHSTGNVFSMPFRKDSVELRNKVENAIECLKLDGTIAGLSEKWFGVTPAEGSAAVTPYPGYGIPGMPGHDPVEREPDCG